MKTKLYNEINGMQHRSAWNKGVNEYALELVDSLDEVPCNVRLLRKALLNGADSWREYSFGGCALSYDCDIADRLCTPSDLKRARNGERYPNPRETWLDVQARALSHACNRVLRAFKRIN